MSVQLLLQAHGQVNLPTLTGRRLGLSNDQSARAELHVAPVESDRLTNPQAGTARLGIALRELRVRQNLKQIELATAAGMAESQISDIERGKNNPGWLLLTRVLTDGLNLNDQRPR